MTLAAGNEDREMRLLGHEDAFEATAATLEADDLDRYLAAHKQFAGSSALGVPSAFLRSATVETNGR